MAERFSSDEAADNSAYRPQHTDSSRSQSLQDEGTDIPENVHTDESPDIRIASVEGNDDEGAIGIHLPRNVENIAATGPEDVEARIEESGIIYREENDRIFWQNNRTDDDRNFSQRTMRVFDVQVYQDFVDGSDGQQFHLPRNVENIAATGPEDVEARIEEFGIIYREENDTIDLRDQSRIFFPSELHEVPDDEPNLPH